MSIADYSNFLLGFVQICQGGKIPKSYYLKNIKNEKMSEDKEKYLTATVKKGDKLCINYLAAEEGSFLRYEK